MELAVSQLEHK